MVARAIDDLAQALDGSGVDAAAVVAEQYGNTSGVTVIAKQGFLPASLQINMTVKPFDNVKVRQAMQYAIDYKGLVAALRDYGIPGYAGLLMHGQTGYDASVNPQLDLRSGQGAATPQGVGRSAPRSRGSPPRTI